MKTILFCGGGSAGHVIPNIALIEELKEHFNCVYMGTRGIEKDICAQNSVEFYECNTPKLVRGKILVNLKLPFSLFKSVRHAGELLDIIKPDLIFSKGGYACVPAVMSAKKRKIPVITHESDLHSGLATKFIARHCNKVLTSFPQTAKKFSNGIYSGSPMRKNLFSANKATALEHFGLDFRPTIVVLGGGSGSKVINETVRKIAGRICKDYNILHLCGKNNITDTTIYGYKQIEFATNMGLVYACADAAVSRCGSNTAFELIALKIPTLFIPLANSASRGDQIDNAEYFKEMGLCSVLNEKGLTPENLYSAAVSVINDRKIKAALNAADVKCGNELIKNEIIRTIRQRS